MDVEGAYHYSPAPGKLPSHQVLVYWRDFVTVTIIAIALPVLIQTLIKGGPGAAAKLVRAR